MFDKRIRKTWLIILGIEVPPGSVLEKTILSKIYLRFRLYFLFFVNLVICVLLSPWAYYLVPFNMLQEGQGLWCFVKNSIICEKVHLEPLPLGGYTSASIIIHAIEKMLRFCMIIVGLVVRSFCNGSSSVN